MAKQRHYEKPFQAAVSSVFDRTDFRNRIKAPVARIDFKGKTVLITGANSGLGFASSVLFARQGAEVLMACRSGIPGAGEKVRKKSGQSKVDMVSLDLSDLDSVKTLSQRLDGKKIDTLVLNAGVVTNKTKMTDYGLDLMFLVNFLANVLLIDGLLEAGAFNEGKGQVPRIVFVSSECHRDPKEFPWDDFHSPAEFGIGDSLRQYGNSKLFLTTYAVELGRRLKGRISVHVLCPGAVNTNIAREAPRILHPLIRLFFLIFFKSPRKASAPVLYLSGSREPDGQTGWYLHTMIRKEVSPLAADAENGKRIWEDSHRLLKTLAE